ncbi:hypothetical protein NMG29_20585 [Streptomyces cocklensis]|jgi:hypothetical protein|uniref:Membrane protein n=1 Tax=Actinacidiphila cocklensis TaxID=887465 RepID=A0A9W4E6J7_9ACTN|nr:hypothetical protein [Actinacidiphila cocklensis]MDD1060574.1 hypothetical protein [Actinacidiphila cocklensis]WSX73898.1 hypothetical protein OH826_08515 [Streptomyces sp. NBC_00899]WSX80037.1 hypothetical protein OH826_42995 [Streptomyces sp. NBC_00899]CAG6393981.1 putative membrane protein [Actinacidiphila cocklensis]
MSIDWHALGSVLAVTLLSTVGLVGVFTLGVVGLSRPGAVAARGGAYVCFAACAAAVAWGIWLIVAK